MTKFTKTCSKSPGDLHPFPNLERMHEEQLVNETRVEASSEYEATRLVTV